MKSTIAFGIVLLAVTAHVRADETVRYVALVNGGTAKAGHQWVTKGSDGTTKVDFDFKDNGRGPTLKEEYKLGADGTFVTYHVTGTSEIGSMEFQVEARGGGIPYLVRGSRHIRGFKEEGYDAFFASR